MFYHTTIPGLKVTVKGHEKIWKYTKSSNGGISVALLELLSKKHQRAGAPTSPNGMRLPGGQ